MGTADANPFCRGNSGRWSAFVMGTADDNPFCGGNNGRCHQNMEPAKRTAERVTERETEREREKEGEMRNGADRRTEEGRCSGGEGQ